MAMLFILIGCAGPYFDVSTPSQGDSATIAGNRLSFLSLSLSACSAWAPAGADYYVYYPERTPKRLTFILTYIGENLSEIFTFLMGAGIASGESQHTTQARFCPVNSADNDVSFRNHEQPNLERRKRHQPGRRHHRRFQSSGFFRVRTQNLRMLL